MPSVISRDLFLAQKLLKNLWKVKHGVRNLLVKFHNFWRLFDASNNSSKSQHLLKTLNWSLLFTGSESDSGSSELAQPSQLSVPGAVARCWHLDLHLAASVCSQPCQRGRASTVRSKKATPSRLRRPLVSASARPRQHRSVGEASALVTCGLPCPRSRRALNARQRPPPKSWARPFAHLLPRPSPCSVPSAINGHPLPPVGLEL